MTTQNHNRRMKNPRNAGRKAVPYGDKKQKVWTFLQNKTVCLLEDRLKQTTVNEKPTTVSEYVAKATVERMQRDGFLQQ